MKLDGRFVSRYNRCIGRTGYARTKLKRKAPDDAKYNLADSKSSKSLYENIIYMQLIENIHLCVHVFLMYIYIYIINLQSKLVYVYMYYQLEI